MIVGYLPLALLRRRRLGQRHEVIGSVPILWFLFTITLSSYRDRNVEDQ